MSMIKSYTLWNEDAWFHLVDQGIKPGGVLPYMGYIGTVCAAPKGMVFQPFWS